MAASGFLLVVMFIVGMAVLILNIWILIVVLDAARAGAEFFHRENAKARQESGRRAPRQ